MNNCTKGRGGLKRLLSSVLGGLYGLSAVGREGCRWLRDKKVEGLSRVMAAADHIKVCCHEG